MYEKGLAYKKMASVNFCPSCNTVLANEQVENGSCWRCSSIVEERELEQWFLRITAYADELLEGLETLKGHWPDSVILMQKNWIGKSIGAEVDFPIHDSDQTVRIFTTRPDTLFGATFIILSPEHELIFQITPDSLKSKVSEYIEKTKKIPKKIRSIKKDKEGIFLNRFAINPLNDQKIPIWTADYVLPDYGTGAIMCVPAHDQRDFEFAKKYNLPIKVVIENPFKDQAYEGEGRMIASGQFSGLQSNIGREKIIEYLENKKIGTKKINYKLKDWLISRQRYWGTPIPVIYCENCGILTVPEENLPVLLPENVEFTGKNMSPLVKNERFLYTTCHKCKKIAKRETDTMDTFVDSSWYFLRYLDPENQKQPFSKNANRWLPVDQYIGGIEHACMHLIYARFFYKVMRDLGLVESDEPFTNLLTQGMVTLGGTAMSKSKGNIVEPSECIEKYGVDTTRLFILFAVPPEKQLEWSTEGIEGCRRFLNRVQNLVKKIIEVKEIIHENEPSKQNLAHYRAKQHDLLLALNKTIKKVTQDIENKYQFNTAIASIMELTNELQAYPYLGDEISRKTIENIILLLSPFVPHISEELWKTLGKKNSVRQESWPKYEEKYLLEEEVEIIIQVNGKLRGTLKCRRGLQEEAVKEKVLEIPKINQYCKNIKKIIFIKDKLINIVT